MNGTNHFIPLLLCLATLSGSAAATGDNAEQDEYSQFLELLEQQTSLATQTRLNADFVPGILSVLTFDQMQRRGFRTLWEALASMPGVNATMNETGMLSVSIRGVGGLFETGKIKLLMNGKSFNASASATTGTIYHTPVEQIERVELIRGPGSAIHGEFAYAGVLNVITRQQGEQYSAGLDSDSGASIAALYSFDKPADDFRASINFAANDTRGQDVNSGDDASAPGIASYAPGPINNKRDFVSAIVSVESKDLSALLQFQQGNRGDHFGANNLLPPDKKQTVISDSLLSADVSGRFGVNEKLKGDWSISLLRNSTEQNQLFLGTAENFGGLGTEDDIVSDSLLTEQRIEGRMRMLYEMGRHALMGELQLANLSVTGSKRTINLDPGTRLPSDSMNEFPVPIDESDSRDSFSLVLQDEFHIDTRTTLTGGLRYDNYEDIGSNLSPRISLVWRKSDSQIYKFQLARAFSPPSLIEASGSIEPNINPATNDTLELGHIYRQPSLVVRNTIYFSRLDDLIMFQDETPFGYRNVDSFSLRGYELEIEQAFASKWKLVGNLSLQDYVGEALPGETPWMVKLGVEYQLPALTSLHLQLNSFSRRDRTPEDTRDSFEQVNQLDFSLRSRNLLAVGGLDFRLGIDNLLGNELKQPAPAETYPDDYPYSSAATVWLQLSYQP